MKRLFLDADVVLDKLLAREPWDSAAQPLWEAIAAGQVEALISGITPVNGAYIVRKLQGLAAVRPLISDLLKLTQPIAVTDAVLRAALTSSITDFEDAVQHECALAAGAEAIITRDLKDFQGARLPVFNPAALPTAKNAKALGES